MKTNYSSTKSFVVIFQNIIPRHLYTDEVFEDLIKEINQKHVDGFELMANSTNLVIYRRPKGVSCCNLFLQQ